MVVVELTTLRPPYAENGSDWMRTKMQILSGTPPMYGSGAATPAVAKQLIRACLRLNPDERPDAMDIIVHLTADAQ